MPNNSSDQFFPITILAICNLSLWTVCLSVCLGLSVCLSVCLSDCLSARSVCLSVCLSLSVCQTSINCSLFCATIDLITSRDRMDSDNYVKKIFHSTHPNYTNHGYFQMESHIFFDDAIVVQPGEMGDKGKKTFFNA